MITWLKQPKYDETLVARRTIYESADHRFRVVKSRPILSGLAVMVYAMARRDCTGFCGGECWDILSKHRATGPAFKAVEREARLVSCPIQRVASRERPRQGRGPKAESGPPAVPLQLSASHF